MVAERREQSSQNNLITGVQWRENGTDFPTVIPTRAPRLCDCGCRTPFTPTRNSHRYIKGHSQRRFVEAKKDALVLFLEALLMEHGASPETASRRAVEAADWYFCAWCKTLAKCGYVYQTKTCEWKRGVTC